MPEGGQLLLEDAVTQFLSCANIKDTIAYQQPLQRFVRWCGKERPLKGLRPYEIESFGQNSGADSVAKLAPVKDFLAYAHKEGLTTTNLATHLKVKRAPVRQRAAKQAALMPTVRLSRDGLERTKAELEELKGQRVVVAQEIQRAMADKDFRENAPLDAARDKQGHLEGRIRELEHTLRFAEVMEEPGQTEGDNHRAKLGAKLVVHDLQFGEELVYTLVDPKEVDLAKGKISVESPAGRAFLNRGPGEVVEVAAPAGALKYRIERIEA